MRVRSVPAVTAPSAVAARRSLAQSGVESAGEQHPNGLLGEAHS